MLATVMFRSDRTMFWTAAVHIICATFFTLLQVLVVLSTKYELQEAFTDMLCSPAFMVSVFHAPSPLTCLVICSTNTTCPMFIHNRESKLCYRLRPGFKTEDCSTKSVGARLFMQERVVCPDGWTYQYKSCYKFFSTSQNQEDTEAKCKSVHQQSHIADFNSEDEFEKVHNWLLRTGDLTAGAWLGATYDGNVWKWSDGTPMLYRNLDYGMEAYDKTCLIYHITMPYWIPSYCGWKFFALCELDVE